MAGGLAIRWNRDPGTLIDVNGLEAAIAAAGPKIADEYQGWAKANHPWTNRTGAAQADLTATATFNGGALIVTLVNGVWYGIYLEYAHGGVWGVLPQATAATLPKAVELVNAAIAEAIG